MNRYYIVLNKLSVKQVKELAIKTGFTVSNIIDLCSGFEIINVRGRKTTEYKIVEHELGEFILYKKEYPNGQVGGCWSHDMVICK